MRSERWWKEWLVIAAWGSFFSCVTDATSQWLPDGNVVCDTATVYNSTLIPTPAPDGKGGLFVCWVDQRSGNLDIYMQRMSSSGEALWKENGIGVIEWPGDQGNMAIVSDGQGGAIVVWEDYRSYDTFIYAQRIDSSGNHMWPDSGVKVSSYPGLIVRSCSDGLGGVIAFWEAYVTNNFDVAAQRVDGEGNLLWGSNAILVSNRPQDVWADEVFVSSDGHGGAYAVWVDGLVAYAQRLDAGGTARWGLNGMQISEPTDEWPFGVVCCEADPSSGVFFWGMATGGRPDGHAQKIDTSGAFLWGTTGVVFDSVGAGGVRRLSPDDAGGTFVGHGLFVQHVDRNAQKLWPAVGVKFTSLPWNLESSQAPSPSGGLWNFWQSLQEEKFIYGQYIDPSGIRRWGTTGIRMSNFQKRQQYPKALSNNDGTCYVTWEEFRHGHWTVYVSRYDTLGKLTSVREESREFGERPRLDQNYPNPFNGETVISYYLPRPTVVKLSVHDILGREVALIDRPDMGEGEHLFRYSGKDLASGIYILRLITAYSSQAIAMLLLR